VFPSTACLLQQRLDIHGCAAFDVQAVCTGFVYALGVADKFIRTGSARCALVVGAETLSRIIDWRIAYLRAVRRRRRRGGAGGQPRSPASCPPPACRRPATRNC
jgi:acetyl-CoA acetyltransferase